MWSEMKKGLFNCFLNRYRGEFLEASYKGFIRGSISSVMEMRDKYAWRYKDCLSKAKDRGIDPERFGCGRQEARADLPVASRMNRAHCWIGREYPVCCYAAFLRANENGGGNQFEQILKAMGGKEEYPVGPNNDNHCVHEQDYFEGEYMTGKCKKSDLEQGYEWTKYHAVVIEEPECNTNLFPSVVSCLARRRNQTEAEKQEVEEESKRGEYQHPYNMNRLGTLLLDPGDRVDDSAGPPNSTFPCSASCLKGLVVNVEILPRPSEVVGNRTEAFVVSEVVVSAAFNRLTRIEQPERKAEGEKWFGYELNQGAVRTDYMWASKELESPVTMRTDKFTGFWMRWRKRNEKVGPVLEVRGKAITRGNGSIELQRRLWNRQ